MSFTEANTVEQMILDAVEKLGRATTVEPLREPLPGWADFAVSGLKWSNLVSVAKF
jgi:hypothetical protein